jgi:hypothetical protein
MVRSERVSQLTRGSLGADSTNSTIEIQRGRTGASLAVWYAAADHKRFMSTGSPAWRSSRANSIFQAPEASN